MTPALIGLLAIPQVITMVANGRQWSRVAGYQGADSGKAREAGTVKILGVFDLDRNAFMQDVLTLKEQGFDIDNASVNFRGVMVPKGTPQGVIDKLAATVPAKFENARVALRMKAGGSPMHIMTRDEVQEM